MSNGSSWMRDVIFQSRRKAWLFERTPTATLWWRVLVYPLVYSPGVHPLAKPTRVQGMFTYTPLFTAQRASQSLVSCKAKTDEETI